MLFPHPSELPSRKTVPDTRCLSTQHSISAINGAGRILPAPSGPPVRNSYVKYWANSDGAQCLGLPGRLIPFSLPFSFPLTSQSGKVSLLLPSFLTPGLSTLRRLSSTSLLSTPFPFKLECAGSPCSSTLLRLPILRLDLCADPGVCTGELQPAKREEVLWRTWGSYG